MTELDLIVTAKYPCADDVVAVEFADPNGGLLPTWTPGAHIEVRLLPGLARRYSLVGGDQRTWRIAVLREPHSRGGSRHIHENVTTGTVLTVDGPYNDFELHDADRYVFIAGGIGITPILPMVQAATRSGKNFSLFYGGRRRTSMAFLDDLECYGERVTIHPHDEAGLLPLEHALSDLPTGTLVYCCGPTPLLDAVRARSRTWPAGTLHLEQFSAKADGGTFTVRLARSDMTLTVPAHKSILEVLEEAGIDVLSACRSGNCGTCEIPVLAGAVDHRDTVLDDQETDRGETMMICVSRSLTSLLTLDL